MSNYTGLFVQYRDGNPVCVQVEDSAGIGLTLPPSAYIERQIRPPIGDLPDADTYQSTKEYRKWVKSVSTTLAGRGFDAALVHRVFEEVEDPIKSNYSSGDLTAAGVQFVKAMEKYDLDLEIAFKRGGGELKKELAAEYGLSPDQANRHWTSGFTKKVVILASFRGEEIGELPSFNF